MKGIVKGAWKLARKMTGKDISNDIEYKDWCYCTVELRANREKVKSAISKLGLDPMETGPNETKVLITGCDMKDVQTTGPYKEVSIKVPVVPLKEDYTPSYAHLYLPVDSDFVHWAATEVNGFNSSLNTIKITDTEHGYHLKLLEEEHLIFDIDVNDPGKGEEKDVNFHFHGKRNDKIIMTSFENRGTVFSKEFPNASIILGNHRISHEIDDMLLSHKVARIEIGKDLSGTLKKPVVIE